MGAAWQAATRIDPAIVVMVYQNWSSDSFDDPAAAYTFAEYSDTVTDNLSGGNTKYCNAEIGRGSSRVQVYFVSRALEPAMQLNSKCTCIIVYRPVYFMYLQK